MKWWKPFLKRSAVQKKKKKIRYFSTGSVCYASTFSLKLVKQTDIIKDFQKRILRICRPLPRWRGAVEFCTSNEKRTVHVEMGHWQTENKHFCFGKWKSLKGAKMVAFRSDRMVLLTEAPSTQHPPTPPAPPPPPPPLSRPEPAAFILLCIISKWPHKACACDWVTEAYTATTEVTGFALMRKPRDVFTSI